MAKSPAWTRKEGKDPKGGLNAKGRASYNKANPGKPGLKAPQPEGGSRKKSFCARMEGMKKSSPLPRPPTTRTAGSINPSERGSADGRQRFPQADQPIALVERQGAGQEEVRCVPERVR